jgi:integrase
LFGLPRNYLFDVSQTEFVQLAAPENQSLQESSGAPQTDGDGSRGPEERVFLNRYGHPITRFGVYDLVKRSIRRAVRGMPSLVTKNVSPHTMRRSTATHLLRGGVDINTVRDWLGHVSVDTTNLYARVDLETKAKAIAHCEPEPVKPEKHWSKDKGLMAFLRNL